MKKTVDIYDKKSVYQEEMEPRIYELIQIAKENSIPIMITAAICNSSDATEYASNVLLASTELSLFENRIANILFLLNDFYADAPSEIQHMADELTHYLKASIPDIQERLDIKLTDDKLSELYKAACRNTALRFPEGIFPSPFEEN